MRSGESELDGRVPEEERMLEAKVQLWLMKGQASMEKMCSFGTQSRVFLNIPLVLLLSLSPG